MSSQVQIIEYDEPEVNYGEISRYLGMKGLLTDSVSAVWGLTDVSGKSDNRLSGTKEESQNIEISNAERINTDENLQILTLVSECLREALPKLKYRVCYRELDSVEMVESGIFDLEYLKNARSLVIFGATIGIEIDRLINKYSRISVAKAAIFEAIGNERIESLCDAFNDDVDSMAFDSGLITKNRISPGYGKFSLESQKKMFELLDLPRRGGIFLNDSLLMSPSKSVTAVISVFDAYEKIVEDIRQLSSRSDDEGNVGLGSSLVSDKDSEQAIKPDLIKNFEAACYDNLRERPDKEEVRKDICNKHSNKCDTCEKEDCEFRNNSNNIQ